MDDRAVRLVFGSVHSWSKRGTVKHRDTYKETAQAHETGSPDIVDRAIGDVARPRSAPQKGVVGGAAGTGEARGDRERAREGFQAARTAAAVSRAAKRKASARNGKSERVSH